jgi:hypothetical protein
MPESDVVLEEGWTSVIQSLRLRTAEGADPDIRMRPRWAVLHLGGGDGSNSDGDVKWYDRDGNNVIHFSATETQDFDSDISAVGEDGYLQLGGNDADGFLSMRDSNGNVAVEVESFRGGSITLNDHDGDEYTWLSSSHVQSESGDFGEVMAGESITAEHGVIGDLDLGGGNPNEDVYEPGTLNVWSDEGKEGVVVDGQSGSIQHTGSITQVSDARAKRSVEPVEDALDTVRELEGVEFEWDDSADLPVDDGRHVGFLAQQVAEVLPEAVEEHTNGYEGTADAAFTPVLVEAVKELAETVEDQRETIDEQRAELDAREARLADQRDRVAALESRLADLEAEVRGEE